MFDEQPDGDPHGECEAEIHRLEDQVRKRDAELWGQTQTILNLNAEIAACAAALPGTRYMDPLDGGSVTVSEQVARMAVENRILRDTLRGIAEADWRKWDPEMRSDREFVVWAKSRARHALIAASDYSDGITAEVLRQKDRGDRLCLALKMAYCQKIGADDPTGLECRDDYRDWVNHLRLAPIFADGMTPEDDRRFLELTNKERNETD